MLGSKESCLENGADEAFCSSVCQDLIPNSIVKGNSLELMKCLPDESIDLVITSPPYGNRRKKIYDGAPVDKYSEWFLPFSAEIKRILKPSGSFLLNIGDIAIKGERKVLMFIVWSWILKIKVGNGLTTISGSKVTPSLANGKIASKMVSNIFTTLAKPAILLGIPTQCDNPLRSQRKNGWKKFIRTILTAVLRLQVLVLG